MAERELVTETFYSNPQLQDGSEIEQPEGAAPKKGRYVTAVLSVANKVNKNRRLYTREELEVASNRFFTESASLYPGTNKHPKPGQELDYTDSVVLWEERWWDGDNLMGRGRIVETAKGKDLIANLDAGVKIGFSTRGYAKAKPKTGPNGAYNEMTDYLLETIDVVVQPSEVSARMVSYVGESVKMEEDFRTLVTEAAEAKAELKANARELERANASVTKLEAALESVNTEVAELRSKISVLESENAELKTHQAQEGANAELLKLTQDHRFGESIRVKVRELAEDLGVKLTVESVSKLVERVKPLVENVAAAGNGAVEPRGVVTEEPAKPAATFESSIADIL